MQQKGKVVSRVLITYFPWDTACPLFLLYYITNFMINIPYVTVYSVSLHVYKNVYVIVIYLSGVNGNTCLQIKKQKVLTYILMSPPVKG